MDAATSAQVAQAVAAAAVQAGQDTPAVRGADWQTPTVTAVNADGTVSCGTAIRARRLDSYTNAAVGDQIMLTRSGTGSWIAVGRTATGPSGEFADFTPTWTATSNPTLGNGTLQGRYTRYGRLIAGFINLTIGSTTTGGSGAWSWDLPAPASASGLSQLGVVEFLRSGAERYDGHGVISPGSSSFGIYLPQKAGTAGQVLRVGATASPMSPASSATFANSWSSGDQLRIQFQYEAAT